MASVHKTTGLKIAILGTGLLGGFIATPIQAAISVRIVGLTATQALLGYTAPDANPCTITVKDDNGALVHDVDSTLFPGADQDTARLSSIVDGTTRVVVIGERAAEKAADGTYYSRALQAYTAHTYQIRCQGDAATGVFTTQNIPLGNTYNDPYPVDPAHPGQYAWPTLNLSDPRQRIVDPKTGLLIYPYATSATTAAPYPPAGGDGFCASTTLTIPTGESGVFCDHAGVLTFINAATGAIRHLGTLGYSSGLGHPIFDRQDPTMVYSMDGYGGIYQFLSLKYQGDYREFSGALPLCPVAGSAPCALRRVISAGHKTLADLMREVDPTLNPSYCNNIAFTEDGQHVFQCTRTIQDSYGWVAVYDPAQDKLVAFTSTYKQQAAPGHANPPTRWGSLHAAVYEGDGWVAMASNILQGNGTFAGYGPYVTQMLSGTWAAAPETCPSDTPYGTAGTAQCTTITVDTDVPYDPTPQTDAGTISPIGPTVGGTDPVTVLTGQPGDYLVLQPDGQSMHDGKTEFLRLLKKSGPNNLTWVVQRGVDWFGTSVYYPGIVKDHPGITRIFTCPSAPRSAHLANYHWHYKTDPWGTNADGQSWIVEPWGGSHSNEGNNYFISRFYQVTNGPLPQVWAGGGTTYNVDAFAPFDGLAKNTWIATDTHPTDPTVDANGVWILDGHPAEKGANASDNNLYPADALGGNLYHYTSNAYGGYPGASMYPVKWDPKHGPVYAFCGDHVLADVSGPASQLTGNGADSYNYCIAKTAGECVAGSKIGDVYVNCPGVTQPYCKGALSPTTVDICLGQNGGTLGAITQTDISKPDSAGANGRILTYGFSRYFTWDPFWNAQLMGNTGTFMFDVAAPNGALMPDGSRLTQIYIAKLPPFPAQDNVSRHDYLSIPYTVAASTVAGVTNAVVQFGYAENGAPSQLYCSGRRESCVKGNQAGNEFGYASESVTGVACANGCTVHLPALPQRMLYFQVLYRDAANAVIAHDGIRAVASEPPFSVSDSGNVLPPPTQPSTPLVLSSLSSLKVYPNPWRSDKHGGKPITFDGLTLGTTIKLFTVSAHRVKELRTDGPSVTWDLTNDSGDRVASGIYLYLVTDRAGDKVKGKIAVMR